MKSIRASGLTSGMDNRRKSSKGNALNAASEDAETPEPKSNFDELTPEEQECVRERFAYFFLRIYKK